MLSGKYEKGVQPSAGSRMGDRGFFFPPFDAETGFDVIEELKQVAAEQGVTPAQVALAWLAIKNQIILVGARSMEQFEENLGCLDVQLTAEQTTRLDEKTKPRVEYPQWMIERQGGGRTFPIAKSP
jgi:aryl-alcohol dehydrogenase-like predicted oxidoreductase